MRQSGRTIPLSLPRRIIGDLMYFAQRVPTVPVQRLMNLSTLVQTRRRLAQRPSWVILFTKAYAMVCEQIPELRRSYLAWPTARLYEHAQSIASVAIQRQYEGEPSVWFARLREPHRQPIVELERLLRQQRELPLTQIKHMRRLLHVARWWQPLRRLAWALALNCSGVWRERYCGTFGVTVYSKLGAESLHPLSPLTTTLNYGVIGDGSQVPVRIIYDHRVMDGPTVARALAMLEQVLTTAIHAEVESLLPTEPNCVHQPLPASNIGSSLRTQRIVDAWTW